MVDPWMRRRFQMTGKELEGIISGHFTTPEELCSLLLFSHRFTFIPAMASPRMIDIDVNFTDNMFKGIYHGNQCHLPDIQTVLARVWRSGVDRIIVTRGSLEESKEALAIAESDGRLFCTVGVHPTRCQEFEEKGDPEHHYQIRVGAWCLSRALPTSSLEKLWND